MSDNLGTAMLSEARRRGVGLSSAAAENPKDHCRPAKLCGGQNRLERTGLPEALE